MNETSPQAEDRVARATAALNRATADVTAGAGTTAERRARAEAGIVEISGIADETADVAERYAIVALNESLAKLIDTLERGESQGRR
ncbi:hypothetical protein [Kribbella sp. NPDC048915]|uniref:hypothetical protein n=1 Tax=Kribbella sp. NPDC048915 TaxID=3155148 RepID=UPI0033CDD723